MSIPNKYVWLKAALAVVALTYLARVVEIDKILEAAAAANGWWILAAAILLAANVSLEGWKWHIMVTHLAPDVRFRESFGAMMSGHALGFFTPARLGDYAGRAFYLRYENKWELAALTFADRMLNLVCYVSFGIVALLYFLLAHLQFASFTWYAIFFLGFVAGGSLLFLVLHPSIAHTFLSALLPFKRIQSLLNFLDRFTTRDAHVLLWISAIRYMVVILQFLFLILAFQPSMSILHAVAGITLVFFAKSAIPSITLMDLGIREGASVYFLGAFGLPEAMAFNAAFLLFCINILGPALIGAPFILRLRFGARAVQPSATPAGASTGVVP